MFDVKSEAKKIENEIINWRRELHQIPEIHDNLPLTTAYVKECIKKEGLEYKEYSNGGITCVVRGKQDGQTIGFRADMDALPVKEETGLPFASKNENMHACGHDAHTAMLIGAMKILNAHKDELNGNVVCIFQPAEETTGGAKIMVDEGCLDDPKVDRFISLHIGSLFETVDNGKIGVKKGPMMAGVSSFYVTVKGKGGHGARPNECVDPILISCEMIQSLQKIVSREISPTHGAVVTVGQIHGGTIVNVIPDEVSFSGTIRTLTPEDADYIEKRIKEMLPEIAKANRATASIQYMNFYPPTVNDNEVADFFSSAAEKIVGKENVVDIEEPIMGTEDVTYYIRHTKGNYGILGSWKKHSDGEYYPHHNPRFHIDESVLWIGSAVFCQCAIDFLNK